MKKEYLFTKEKVIKSILILSLPLILSQIVNVLYNIVDRIFIGNMPVVGKDALAGVGISFPIIIIVSAFAALFGMGGGPQAAIKLGENKKEEAQEIMNNSFILLSLVGVFLTFILLIFGKQLLYLFGATDDIIEYSLSYLNIYAIGTIFVMLSIGLSFYISAQGNTVIAAVIVLIGAILNIIFDPILIYVFNLGVKGAAIATIFSQAVSAILSLIFLTSNKSTIKLRFTKLKLNKKIVLSIVSLGISPFIMQSTEALIQIVFNNQIVKYGGNDYIIYLNIMTIMLSILQFMVLPVQGLTQGASPLISYNYGNNNVKRVKESYRVLIIMSLIYTLVFYLLILFFPKGLISIFTKEELVINYSPKIMRMFFFGMAFMGIQFACQMTFMSLNQPVISLTLAILRKIVILIPLAYIFPIFVGINGVFFSETVADLLAVIITFTVFVFSIDRILLRKKPPIGEIISDL